jgi:hypothetical protein
MLSELTAPGECSGVPMSHECQQENFKSKTVQNRTRDHTTVHCKARGVQLNGSKSVQIPRRGVLQSGICQLKCIHITGQKTIESLPVGKLVSQE